MQKEMLELDNCSFAAPYEIADLVADCQQLLKLSGGRLPELWKKLTLSLASALALKTWTLGRILGRRQTRSQRGSASQPGTATARAESPP